ETDGPYLCRAAEVLGRSQLFQSCEIQWVGAKDERGQGYHTGKSALDHTLSFLRANPKLINRPILLLYDNDAQKVDADYGEISVRSVPTNKGNTKIKTGIENLLAETAITDADYQTEESIKPNGDSVKRKTLRKSDLCQRICHSGSEEDFSAFALALDIIKDYLDLRKV